MADKPCDQCKHYDPIKVGKDKTARHGWCSLKSIYPNKEMPGQTFPPGVKRAAVGDRATPVIMVGSECAKACHDFTDKPVNPAKKAS